MPQPRANIAARSQSGALYQKDGVQLENLVDSFRGFWASRMTITLQHFTREELEQFRELLPVLEACFYDEDSKTVPMPALPRTPAAKPARIGIEGYTGPIRITHRGQLRAYQPILVGTVTSGDHPISWHVYQDYHAWMWDHDMDAEQREETLDEIDELYVYELGHADSGRYKPT